MIRFIRPPFNIFSVILYQIRTCICSSEMSIILINCRSRKDSKNWNVCSESFNHHRSMFIYLQVHVDPCYRLSFDLFAMHWSSISKLPSGGLSKFVKFIRIFRTDMHMCMYVCLHVIDINMTSLFFLPFYCLLLSLPQAFVFRMSFIHWWL